MKSIGILYPDIPSLYLVHSKFTRLGQIYYKQNTHQIALIVLLPHAKTCDYKKDAFNIPYHWMDVRRRWFS